MSTIQTAVTNNYNFLHGLNHSPSTIVSDKYNFLDTRELVNTFTAQGFNQTDFGKTSLRKPIDPTLDKLFASYDTDQQQLLIDTYTKRLDKYNARLGHERHFLRFKSDSLPQVKGHDMFLRVSNSYDGSSSLKISLDMLRLVCLNGLVAPRSIFQFAITHRSKDIYADAIEATYKIIAKKDILEEQITRMSDKVLTQDEKLLLVDNMLKFRFDDKDIVLSEQQKLKLLVPIRKEEQVDNLYQNFNTVQEKLTKGTRMGLLDANGKPIEMKVREVKSIVTADSFNNQSWEYAYSLVA